MQAVLHPIDSKARTLIETYFGSDAAEKIDSTQGVPYLCECNAPTFLDIIRIFEPNVAFCVDSDQIPAELRAWWQEMSEK